MAKVADYDEPRMTAEESDSLEELRARRSTPAVADVDEVDLGESFELPGADMLDEELTVAVVPMRADEFRCSRCFLVQHRSQRAATNPDLCRECA
jgi:Domain of unknown function (DUF4193)